VCGADVAWGEVLAASGALPVSLPTYAFQRQRYWLGRHSGGSGNVGAAGLRPTDHGLLSAALRIAEDRKCLFTGRLSLHTHPWLADHAVMGVVLLPGAALVELALYAGAQLDCGHVEELLLEAPLLFPEGGATQVQIAVGEPDEAGVRAVSIHSLGIGLVAGESELDEESWIRNATGVLIPAEGGGAEDDLALDGRDAELLSQTWPPADALELDVDEIYRRLADRGFEYGPAFQGLRAAWQLGEEVLAEVSLPSELRDQAGLFGLHPALLDAALHACDEVFDVGAGAYGAGAAVGKGGVFLPFSWSGVRLSQVGASSMRVRLSSAGSDAISLTLADEHGAHVASVRSLTVHQVSAEQLDREGVGRDGSLFCLDWTPVSSAPQPDEESIVLLGGEARLAASIGELDIDAYQDLPSLAEAVDRGLKVPAVVLVDWMEEWSEGLPPESTHAGVKRMLELAQAWLADERYADARLVLVTHGAVCISASDDPPDPVAAAAWGLLRSAIAEHPGRFGLIDLAAGSAWSDLLGTALAAGEEQLAVRDGELLAPRLARMFATQRGGEREPELDVQGTVLITGGTGKLGGFVAKHLVSHHGVPSVVLASRRGRDAEGAAELERELVELGAKVAVQACDVTDRDQLAGLIDGLSQELPLCGVVHAAGVIDDGVIESLTPERVDLVLQPKVDAAWHLHELTRDMDLSMFVLFSSATSVFGTAGQGNYAAANAFTDALAADRQAQGLPATAIAWGLWAQVSGLTAGLDESDLRRFGRSGMRAMSTEEGLGLFDAALRTEQAQAIALHLDTVALRAQARVHALPALLRGLVRVAPVRVAGAHDRPLAKRLRAASAQERAKVALEAVCVEVATVVGHASAQAIDPERPFKDLGFDSLTAVELRNRLAEQTGLRLPATLVFDYPTPTSLAAHLLGEIDDARIEVVSTRTAPTRMDEPIAIVGMSCRYPGGVDSPEELWRLLASGEEAIAGFPDDRGWDLDALYDPDPDRIGTSHAREGGFVRNASEFDPAFFGIGPSEALAMDPQQRLMLEACWEAIEAAWIDPASLRGTRTGVFAGVMHQADYATGLGTQVPPGVDGYLSVGNAGSVISGRVAYTLGLEGPALTVDTACSSSLVALHLACQSLRQGECSLALAGGVTVMSTATVFLEFSLQRGLAPDGRCKSYAAAADGAGFSEGVGVLLLERLSEAQRLGHRVVAVVRGSAVNQDGRSNGLTAPNGPSQQRVIREALANAGLSPRQVDAVEGHGTGTTLGDPIEAQGLLATYGQDRGEGRAPLWLGSIKSNIGHTQAAAGVAGVIKMALAMRHGVLPRTLHVDEPSQNVDWSAGAVSLLSEPVDWVGNGEPRRAGVSSFGISGTNAHVIVEEAPVTAPVTPMDSSVAIDGVLGEERTAGEGSVGGVDLRTREVGKEVFAGDRGDTPRLVLWPVSGRGTAALRAQARRLHEHAERCPELDAVGVGLSLGCKPVFEDRAVVLGRTREQSLLSLDSLARGESDSGLVVGAASREGGGGMVFLFPGQGSQWVGMAVGLLDGSSVFAGCMCACADALAPFVDWSLLDVLRGVEGAPGLERVDVVQPVLFAVMVSLAGLWRACGVRPVAVVGHSQGEIAAAHVAGGLSLEDAARIVALRGRALTALAGRGGMVSVSAGVDELVGLFEGFEDSLSLAAVNGPSSVVVSGDAEALGALLERCVDGGVRARQIPVDYAAHSGSVEEIREELLDGCASVVPCSGEVPFYSTVSGGLLDTAELDAQYWYRNLREPVQLDRVVRMLLADGRRSFIEVSPHPVLTAGVQETVDECVEDPGGVHVVGSLRRDEDCTGRFLKSLAEAFVCGADVAWGEVLAASGALPVSLPTYAFQRQRYWLQAGGGALGDLSVAGLTRTRHPLLGAAVSLAEGEGRLFTGQLSLDTHSWLADHAVMGVVLLPGTVFLELALHVGAELACDFVRELTLESPLVLSEHDTVALQLSVGNLDESGCRTLAIYSRAEGNSSEEQEPSDRGWTRHATGVIAPAGLGVAQPASNGWVQPLNGVWPPQDAQPLELNRLHAQSAERGFDYGPAFQGVRAVWRHGDELLVDVSLPEDQPAHADSFCLHPALLQAVLQPMLVELHGDGMGVGERQGEDAGVRASMPSSFGGVSLHASGARSLRARLRRDEQDTVSLTVADEAGGLVASIDALVTKTVSEADLAARKGGDRESLFGLDWTPVRSGLPLPSESSAASELVLLGREDSPIAEGLRGLGVFVAAYPDLPSLGEAVQAGASLPERVLVDATDSGSEEVVSAARVVLYDVLDALQGLLSDERFAVPSLVVVSRNALAVLPDDGVEGLASTAVWGLVRSAQSENPGRLALLDVDGSESSWRMLPSAVAAAFESEEPQLAVRDGEVLAPRLRRVTSSRELPLPAEGRQWVDPGHSVLITGGMSGLGALVAKHLVAEHGVRSLVLASRRGADAPGARELQSQLEAQGASVSLIACDVGDREQVARLIASVPKEHPLGAVVHAAGVIDDGVIHSLTPERVDRVLTPKLDAAWHLHELTEHLGLSAFVLFSSASGTLGGPGQGNYAAANAFLDGLAAYRQARGLVGMSMAWGLWATATELTGALNEADLARIGRSGLSALSSEEGLALFDDSYGRDDALLLPMRLDAASLRAQALNGSLPGLLRGLVRVPVRRVIEGGSLSRRLTGLTETERGAIVLGIVQSEIGIVLGSVLPRTADPERPFKELGFTSLTGVELRNRLNAVTGLRLPATLVFDYPTPALVTSYLLEQVSPITKDGNDNEQDVRRMIASIPLSHLRDAGLMEVLLRLAGADDHEASPADKAENVMQQIESMDLDDLVQRALQGSVPDGKEI
jgi:acyl transferase domain-containing protein/acyl carrier protein